MQCVGVEALELFGGTFDVAEFGKVMGILTTE